MATLTDLPLMLRTFLRAYPWRRIDPVPWTRLEKPIAACRVALVSTAGLVPPGAPPFDATVRGGDHSYRVIPRDTEVQQLVDCHRSESYDQGGSHAIATWPSRSTVCASWPPSA